MTTIAEFFTDLLNTLTYLILTLLGIEWHKETV